MFDLSHVDVGVCNLSKRAEVEFFGIDRLPVPLKIEQAEECEDCLGQLDLWVLFVEAILLEVRDDTSEEVLESRDVSVYVTQFLCVERTVGRPDFHRNSCHPMKNLDSSKLQGPWSNADDEATHPFAELHRASKSILMLQLFIYYTKYNLRQISMEKDPILEIERMIKDIHDNVSHYTNPVLRKYPLIFAFLVTFSFAAILHAFELITDETPIIKEHPYYLMLAGVLVLILTGTLYKKLEKGEE